MPWDSPLLCMIAKTVVWGLRPLRPGGSQAAVVAREMFVTSIMYTVLCLGGGGLSECSLK